VDECNKEELSNKISSDEISDETDAINDSDIKQNDMPKSTEGSRKTNEANLVAIRKSFIN